MTVGSPVIGSPLSIVDLAGAGNPVRIDFFTDIRETAFPEGERVCSI
jgi:hypothetical protein